MMAAPALASSTRPCALRPPPVHRPARAGRRTLARPPRATRTASDGHAYERVLRYPDGKVCVGFLLREKAKKRACRADGLSFFLKAPRPRMAALTSTRVDGRLDQAVSYPVERAGTSRGRGVRASKTRGVFLLHPEGNFFSPRFDARARLTTCAPPRVRPSQPLTDTHTHTLPARKRKTKRRPGTPHPVPARARRLQRRVLAGRSGRRRVAARAGGGGAGDAGQGGRGDDGRACATASRAHAHTHHRPVRPALLARRPAGPGPLARLARGRCGEGGRPGGLARRVRGGVPLGR
jgi:hypothetical protein